MAQRPAVPPNLPPSRLPGELRERLFRHFRSAVITGLLTLIPLFVTLWILGFLYGRFTSFTYPIAYRLVDYLAGRNAAHFNPKIIARYTAPVLSVIISLAIIYLLGLLSGFVVGRQLLNRVEHLVENLPLIKGIYGTTKQVIGVFRKGGGGSGFQRVVLMEFPRRGIWTVAFVTGTITDTVSGESFVSVFIPMTPNPTSGFFQMVPVAQVRNTDWTVDQGIKIVLSGGLLAPGELNFGSATPPVVAPVNASPVVIPPVIALDDSPDDALIPQSAASEPAQSND